MSTSIYLVSSNEVSSKGALAFLEELHVIDVEQGKISGQVTDGEASVWIKFHGSTVLEESDDEELETWLAHLGENACSFFELTIGKGDGSMQLAVKMARESMRRWNVVVDDLYDSVYGEDNLDEILEP